MVMTARGGGEMIIVMEAGGTVMQVRTVCRASIITATL